MQMLGGRGDSSGGRPEYGSNNDAGYGSGFDQSRGGDDRNQRNMANNDYAAPPKDDFNDDIPF